MKKLCALTALLLIIVTANAQMLDFSLEPNILGINRLNYGQEIEIIARARGMRLAEARSLEMTMRISETETVEYFTQLSHDTFSLKTRMPENRALKRIFISFELSADVGGGIAVNKPHTLELTDELIVTLIEPASGKVRLDNDLERIKARITHINGAPFKQSTVIARLFVNGETETIRLERKDDFFIAGLSEPIPVGENEIILSLTGNYSGSDTSQTEPGLFFAMIFVIIAGGFSLIVLYFLFNYIKSNSGIRTVKKRESKRLEEVSLSKSEEHPETREGIKEIKISEFKKRISEPTFTDKPQSFYPPKPPVQQITRQQPEQPKKMEYILPEEKPREPAYTYPRQQPPVEQRPRQDYDQRPSPRPNYDEQVPETRERRAPILPEEARLPKSYDYARQDRPAKQRRGYEYLPEPEKQEEEIVERKTDFLPKIQPSSEIEERPRKPDYQERQQFSPQRPEPRESRESVEYRSSQQYPEPAEHQKDDEKEKKKKGLSPYFIPRKDER